MEVATLGPSLWSSPRPLPPPPPGALLPGEAADNLWLEDHRTPLRRAAGREPFGKLLGLAGVGRMIYDPDQLFRKQKLT